jgi:hypothetical protein
MVPSGVIDRGLACTLPQAQVNPESTDLGVVPNYVCSVYRVKKRLSDSRIKGRFVHSVHSCYGVVPYRQPNC